MQIILKYIFLCFLSLQVQVASAQTESAISKGVEYVWHSEYDSAKLVLNSIIKNENTNSTVDIGVAYMYLGRANQLQSNFKDAIKLFHRAQTIFQNEKDRNLFVECEIWLAEYHRVLSQFEISKKYLDEATKLVNKRGVTDFTKSLYYSRMAAYSQETENDPERKNVLVYSNLAKQLAMKIKNEDLEATSINEIGFAYENMKDARAIDFYLRAHQLWTKCGNQHYATQSLVNVVRESLKRSEYKRAVFYAKKGFKTALDNKYYMLMQHFAGQIMQVEEKLGNHKKALEYAHIYHDICEGQAYKKWEQTILEVEQKYDLQQQKELTNIQKSKTVVANLEAKRSRTQRNYSIVISVMLVLFLLTVLYFSNNIRNKNRELQSSLDQKQVLLKEVYHRVKNNLTFLSSLLFLRAKSINEEPIKQMILECQTRVHSMGIVHQQLYQLNEYSVIDFHLFCENLFSEIDIFGSDEKRKIKYNVKGNIQKLNLNDSIFVGLIINELTINSIKHARSAKELEIGIELTQSEFNFDVKFCDNGIGLSNDESNFEEGGFGFQMIRILTKQLKSTIIYYKKDNLNYFHLQIPIK